MKDLHPHPADQIENVKQAEIKKTFSPFGRMYPHKGHTVWEFNTISDELHPVTIKTPDTYVLPAAPKKTTMFIGDLADQTKTVGEIEMNPDCIYFTALNRKNAIKLMKKEFGIDYRE